MTKPFALRDSRDLLEKLRWELNNLFLRQHYDVLVCAYHVFNAAVTAWHVTDWLWRDLQANPSVLGRLQQHVGEVFANKAAFQKYVRGECDALVLCHQVANGSKHSEFRAGVAATVSESIGSDHGSPVISGGTTEQPAHKVFYEALFWYQSFLRDWDVFPEEPFVPRSDTEGRAPLPLG
jgi:hypothetical protein